MHIVNSAPSFGVERPPYKERSRAHLPRVALHHVLVTLASLCDASHAQPGDCVRTCILILEQLGSTTLNMMLFI